MRTASISLICASVLFANVAWAQATPAASPPAAPPAQAAPRVVKAPPPAGPVAKAPPPPARPAPAPNAQAAEPAPRDAPPPPAGEIPPAAVVQAPPDMIGGPVPPLDAPPPPPPPPPHAAPHSPAPDSRALLNELALTEDQIDEVQAQRAQYPIGGPIAMMGVGYGGALVFGLASLVAWAGAEEIDRGLDDGDPDYDEFRRSDVDRARTASRVLGGLTVLPLALGITGSVLLTKRLQERRRFGPELQTLNSRKRAIERELRYSFNAGPRAAGLTLTASF